jgi:tripartite ATP-independent transporter DctM subunit
MFLLILFFIFFIAAFGVPIAFSFGIGSLIYCYTGSVDPIVLPQRIFVALDSFTFLAIPFFLLAGNLMNASGVTDKILGLARAMVGHIKGGLGHVNVLASMIFAGLSGSAVADAAGLGVIEIEMMNKGGYDQKFSAAITLSSAIIGPIIPPSIIMIIYAMVSGESVGKMLLAGLFPGIVIGICLMVMVYFIAIRNNFPLDKWAGFKHLFKCLYNAIYPLITPLIIVGGIVSGIFTPTEAGAVASLYTLILGVFVYKTINMKVLAKTLVDTAMFTALIGIILGVSSIFSWIITFDGIPHALVSYITALTSNKYIILLILMFVVLVLGCFIDPPPLIILLVPVLLPLLHALDIDLIHFGIIVSINSMIGTITPPVGTCLYSVSAISGISIDRLTIAVMPFLIMLLVALVIVTFVPQISLFLPNMVFGI